MKPGQGWREGHEDNHRADSFPWGPASFSEAKKNNRCPSSFRMETSLENKPITTTTTLFRAKRKYPEVGEGGGVEARARCPLTAGVIRTAGPLWIIWIVLLKAQKSSNANIPSPPFGIIHHTACKFPNVTVEKVETVYLSMLLMSSHPVMTNGRGGKGWEGWSASISLHSSFPHIFPNRVWKFFASAYSVLNSPRLPVSCLHLSFQVSPGLCCCHSPFLYPFRGTRKQGLFSFLTWPFLALAHAGASVELVKQSFTWGNMACHEHDVTESRRHPGPPAGPCSPTARLRPSAGAKEGRADGRKRGARETKMTAVGAPWSHSDAGRDFLLTSGSTTSWATPLRTWRATETKQGHGAKGGATIFEFFLRDGEGDTSNYRKATETSSLLVGHQSPGLHLTHSAGPRATCPTISVPPFTTAAFPPLPLAQNMCPHLRVSKDNTWRCFDKANY